MAVLGIYCHSALGIIPLIAWLISRQRKELAWAVRSEAPIVKADEALSSRLQVLFDGTVVKDLTSVVIAVKNTGNVPISPTDYYRPVVVKNGRRARVLEAGALQGKNVLQLAVEHTEREITLEKSLFNKNDLFLLACLIEGYEPDALEVTGHIERAPLKRMTYAELASSGRFLSRTIAAIIFVVTSIILTYAFWQLVALPADEPSSRYVELSNMFLAALCVLTALMLYFVFFRRPGESEGDS